MVGNCVAPSRFRRQCAGPCRTAAACAAARDASGAAKFASGPGSGDARGRGRDTRDAIDFPAARCYVCRMKSLRHMWTSSCLPEPRQPRSFVVRTYGRIANRRDPHTRGGVPPGE